MPCPNCFDRSARTWVALVLSLEKAKNTFCAIRSPKREFVMPAHPQYPETTAIHQLRAKNATPRHWSRSISFTYNYMR